MAKAAKPDKVAQVDRGERVEGTYHEARVNLDEFRQLAARFGKEQMADLDWVEGDFGPGELLDVETEKPEAKARPPLAASGRATARPCSAETAGTPTRNLLPC